MQKKIAIFREALCSWLRFFLFATNSPIIKNIITLPEDLVSVQAESHRQLLLRLVLLIATDIYHDFWITRGEADAERIDRLIDEFSRWKKAKGAQIRYRSGLIEMVLCVGYLKRQISETGMIVLDYVKSLPLRELNQLIKLLGVRARG